MGKLYFTRYSTAASAPTSPGLWAAIGLHRHGLDVLRCDIAANLPFVLQLERDHGAKGHDEIEIDPEVLLSSWRSQFRKLAFVDRRKV